MNKRIKKKKWKQKKAAAEKELLKHINDDDFMRFKFRFELLFGEPDDKRLCVFSDRKAVIPDFLMKQICIKAKENFVNERSEN